MAKLKLIGLTVCVLLVLLLPAAAGASHSYQGGGTTGIGSGVNGPGQQPGAGLIQTIRATAPAATYSLLPKVHAASRAASC